MYKLTGVSKTWSGIKKYRVEDERGEKQMIEENEVYRLIESEKIEGYKLLRYKGEGFIWSDRGKISDLEEIERVRVKLKVVGRIEIGKKLQGYVIEDTVNRQFKVSSNKVWEMAMNGDIENIKASIIKGKKSLNGVGINLLSLPKIVV